MQLNCPKYMRKLNYRTPKNMFYYLKNIFILHKIITLNPLLPKYIVKFSNVNFAGHKLKGCPENTITTF